MTRDNDTRSGAANQPPVGALSSVEANVLQKAGTVDNQPLLFTTPTEIIDLPSGGRFYPSGHPLHGVTEVEIRYMTAKEEDILTNSSFIKKGIAIDRMLQSVLVRPKFDVQEMLAGDKNAMIVAARITGFGAEYGAKVTCPVCGEITKHDFDLNDGKIKDGSVLPENVEATDRGTFLLRDLPGLDSRANPVEIRLMMGRDEMALAKSQEQRQKHNLERSLITDMLKMIIVSVGGHSEVQTVNSFVDSAQTITAKTIRNLHRDITPNLDLTQTFVCKSCDNEEEMEVPFTTEFFWPKQ